MSPPSISPSSKTNGAPPPTVGRHRRRPSAPWQAPQVQLLLPFDLLLRTRRRWSRCADHLQHVPRPHPGLFGLLHRRVVPALSDHRSGLPPHPDWAVGGVETAAEEAEAGGSGGNGEGRAESPHRVRLGGDKFFGQMRLEIEPRGEGRAETDKGRLFSFDPCTRFCKYK